MPYNGSGTFTLVANSFYPAVTGSAISSTSWNAIGADLQNNGMSNVICKDGQTTATQRVPFAAGISVSGVNYENKRMAVYSYTAWNPSDVAGTFTNGASTAAATVTAADYITVANASGTTTWTCVLAGLYEFKVDMQNAMGAPATGVVARVTLGGTATTISTALSSSRLYPFSLTASPGFPVDGTVVFAATMTAAQTVTVLPQIAVTSGGVVGAFNTACVVTATYVGAA